MFKRKARAAASSATLITSIAPPADNPEPESPRVTTIEVNQLLFLRNSDSLVETWCKRCGARGQWVNPATAALLANQDTRSIYRRVENGSLHFFETGEGVALVCLASLFNHVG